MTAWALSAVVSVGLAVLVGWAIPAWAMKRLLPALEDSGHLVTNYRGRRIPTGLGLVWLVWAAGVAVVLSMGVVLRVIAMQNNVEPASVLYAILISPIRTLTSTMVLLLVVGTCAFGLVDDLFGGGDEKGFRGHLKALSRGRLTTGGMKLLGIGLLSAVAASGSAAFGLALVPLQRGLPGFLLPVVGWLVTALVIALSANLVNLTDLRPGRALKAYTFLAVTAVAVITVVVGAGYAGSGAGSLPHGAAAVVWMVATAVTALVLLLGPVFAVWRSDLGERAMLGDAGANAMGALAGFMFVFAAPLWLDVVLLVVLLALNLASERFSFSRVIEKVAFLTWIDGLGRLPVVALNGPVLGGDNGTRTGGSAADGDDARKDGGS